MPDDTKSPSAEALNRPHLSAATRTFVRIAEGCVDG